MYVKRFCIFIRRFLILWSEYEFSSGNDGEISIRIGQNFFLTTPLPGAKINASSKTVDAEIKTAVHVQRAWEAESRAERKLLNGPRRAQSKASAEYSATWGHTSVAGDMLVSRKARRFACESRWHRGCLK